MAQSKPQNKSYRKPRFTPSQSQSRSVACLQERVEYPIKNEGLILTSYFKSPKTLQQCNNANIVWYGFELPDLCIKT